MAAAKGFLAIAYGLITGLAIVGGTMLEAFSDVWLGFLIFLVGCSMAALKESHAVVSTWYAEESAKKLVLVITAIVSFVLNGLVGFVVAFFFFSAYSSGGSQGMLLVAANALAYAVLLTFFAAARCGSAYFRPAHHSHA